MEQSKFKKLRRYLLSNIGLNFYENQDRELLRKIKIASKSFNFENATTFVDWLIVQTLNTEQIALLASHLTIGETYFCREKKAFNYLEYEYLPYLIEERRKKGNTKKIKIWSAGCSSGEEAYSIAIILKRLIPDILDWDIKILGTDINPDFIERAKKGMYSKWSFRGVSDSYQKEYFKQTGINKFEINKEIKEMVTFSFLNLVEGNFPSLRTQTTDVDIVFCRNVFIYFSQEGINSITESFANSLLKGGLFVVSPVEVASITCSQLNQTPYKGVTLFNKGGTNKYDHKKSQDVEALFDLEKKQALILDLALKENKKLNTLPLIDATLAEEIQELDTAQKLYIKDTGNLSLKNLPKRNKDVLNITQGTKIKNGNENRASEYLIQARKKANKGNLEASEELCLKAIKEDKINTEAYYLLAFVLNEQGRVKEAISLLTNAIFLNPDFSLAYFLLGNISKKEGRTIEYKKHFRNALKSLVKLNPEEVLDVSDGITVSQLTKIINSIA